MDEPGSLQGESSVHPALTCQHSVDVHPVLLDQRSTCRVAGASRLPGA